MSHDLRRTSDFRQHGDGDVKELAHRNIPLQGVYVHEHGTAGVRYICHIHTTTLCTCGRMIRDAYVRYIRVVVFALIGWAKEHSEIEKIIK